MAEIIPAIAEEKFSEIKKKVAQVDDLVNWVQIDVTDGLFAPNYTWEAWEDLATLDGKVKIEVHLMLERPEVYIADWMKVADRIIVHLESTENMEEIFKRFKHSPVKLGIALLLETPLEKLDQYADKFDLIQLMGIGKIGKQGETFDERVLERVHLLRSRWPDVKISVDGGINLENAESVIEAGADNLVIGSAIWQSEDVGAAIYDFKTAINGLA